MTSKTQVWYFSRLPAHFSGKVWAGGAPSWTRDQPKDPSRSGGSGTYPTPRSRLTLVGVGSGTRPFLNVPRGGVQPSNFGMTGWSPPESWKSKVRLEKVEEILYPPVQRAGRLISTDLKTPKNQTFGKTIASNPCNIPFHSTKTFFEMRDGENWGKRVASSMFFDKLGCERFER